MNPELRRELEKTITDIFEKSKKIVQITKGHPPVLFLLRTNGDVESIDFSSYIEDKDLMAVMLKSYQLQDDLDGTILMTEAWVIKVDKDSEIGQRIGDDSLTEEDLEVLQPSESPDREEVLFFMAETKAGDITAQAPIIRKSKNEATLGELEFMMQDASEFRGRFIGGSSNS